MLCYVLLCSVMFCYVVIQGNFNTILKLFTNCVGLSGTKHKLQRVAFRVTYVCIHQSNSSMAAFRLNASKRLLVAICEYALDPQIFCSDWALVLARSVEEIQMETTGINVISDI